jgi:hypothetical protein
MFFMQGPGRFCRRRAAPAVLVQGPAIAGGPAENLTPVIAVTSYVGEVSRYRPADRGPNRDGAMRLLLAAAFVLLLTGESRASCVCRCIDGEMQPLCESSVDVPPVCPATICALVPPSVTPMQPPVVPPVGTSQCSQRQVLNPTTRRYEWRSVCD